MSVRQLAPLGAAFALSACVVAPAPVVAVPGYNKDQAAFQADETSCRQEGSQAAYGAAKTPAGNTPAVGTRSGNEAAWQRYDDQFAQCMTARGNSVEPLPYAGYGYGAPYAGYGYPYYGYGYGYGYPYGIGFGYPFGGFYGGVYDGFGFGFGYGGFGRFGYGGYGRFGYGGFGRFGGGGFGRGGFGGGFGHGGGFGGGGHGGGGHR